eukprot:6214199-Pleurochrysis_carterae.AAC.1
MMQPQPWITLRRPASTIAAPRALSSSAWNQAWNQRRRAGDSAAPDAAAAERCCATPAAEGNADRYLGLPPTPPHQRRTRETSGGDLSNTALDTFIAEPVMGVNCQVSRTGGRPTCVNLPNAKNVTQYNFSHTLKNKYM